ncbi:MAG: hypothetical protein KF691_04545 [Phycisphaeraceae bacterium]|nr:hypothetical protein [Phycisphaeraceae bacterium]
MDDQPYHDSVREVTCPVCQYGLTALVDRGGDLVVCPECGLRSTARNLLKPRHLVLRVRRSDILAPVGLAAAIGIVAWLIPSVMDSPFGVFVAFLGPMFLIATMSFLRMREYRSRPGYWSSFCRAVAFRSMLVWAICMVAATVGIVALILAS